MTCPKISIITPTYNQGHFIEETILSVIEQGYPYLEYIVIDGGSTDNTVEIIRKYKRYINYWVSEKDKGQSDAINKGLNKASGEIINWLNSDDYYMPGTLHHVAGVFHDKNINAYCGKSRVFSDKSEKISSGTDIYAGNLAKTIGWARIDQPETFFRRNVWNYIGKVNEQFHYVMDKELLVRYLLHFGLDGIFKDDKVLVNFRIHDQSKTGSQIEKFSGETIDLFYSIALYYNLPIADSFQQIKPVHMKPLIGNTGTDLNLLNSSIHYFFLHIALEAYALNNYNLAKKVARLIDTECVKPDVDELEKILFRMKLTPVIIKKAINYFKGL